MLKRINTVTADVLREPGEGIGKPEPWSGLEGTWSSRIWQEHRLVCPATDVHITIVKASLLSCAVRRFE